jgi:hypothetical protein
MSVNKLSCFTVMSTALFVGHANAEFVWDWNGESGTFTTLESGGAAGTYTVTDFSVTVSALGETIGSASGGDYLIEGFSTFPQYTFDWDGSIVTGWHHEGPNTFDWHAYTSVDSGGSYLFAWDTDNNNDPSSAGFFNFGSHNVSGAVAVSYVPTPGGLAAMGLVGVLGASRRRRVSQ